MALASPAHAAAVVNGQLLLPNNGGPAINLTGSPDPYGVAIWSDTEGLDFDARYAVDPSTGTWTTHPDILPPGDYIVIGGAPGNASYANSDYVELTVSANGTFSLPVQPRLKAATLSGVAVLADGSPMRDGHIELEPGEGAPENAWDGVNPGSNGVWAFAPPSGSYTVTAMPDDGTHVPSAPLAVSSSQTGVRLTAQRGNVLGRIMPPAGWAPPTGWDGIEWASVWINRAVSNEWVGHASARSGGLWAADLGPGDYVLTAQPPWDNPERWAAGTATITVGQNRAVTVLNGEPVAAPDGRFDSDGRFDIELQTPNVLGTVTGPNGEMLASGTWLDVEDIGGQHPEHLTGTSTEDNGEFGLRLEDGTYKLTAHPPWNDQNGWVMGSTTITVSGDGATVTGDPNIRLRTANVVGTVVTPDPDNAPVAFAWLDVRHSDGSHPDAWAGTNQEGVFSLFLAQPDTYTVTAHTGWGDESGLAPGRVQVVVELVDGDPVVTSGPIVIKLQEPNVRGTVVEPNSTTPVPGAHVEARRWNSQINRYEWFDGGWFYADDGGFSYKLDQGTYQIEVRPPWGSTRGWAPNSVEIEVDAGGTVTQRVNGGAFEPMPDTWYVGLRDANVRGEIQDPSGAPVPGANVEIRVANEWQHVAWVEADQNGRWATYLEGGDYDVVSRPPWHNPNSYVQTETQIDVAVAGTTTSVTVLEGQGTVADNRLITKLVGPNVTGTVLAPDDGDATTPDEPIDGSWISVTDASGRWVDAWASTGQAGTFGLLLDAGTYTVTAHPGWNNAKGYTAASTPVVLEASSDSANVTIRLATPNVSGTVTASGAGLMNAYVDVRNAATNEWYPGTHTRSGGAFGLSLGNGTWELTAHPPYGHTGGHVATKKTVTVSGGKLQGDTNIVLDGANVTGTIVGTSNDVTNPVPNVGIGVRDNDTGAWVDAWAWTGSDGAFSLRLPTGNYRLTANPGWGSSGGFGNAVVDVTVNGANVVSAVTPVSGSAVLNDNGTIRITLPGANVSGKVFQPGSTTQVVKDAFVYATTPEGWWVDNGWTQTDAQGQYNLTLPAGDYIITAQPPWWGDQAWTKASETVTASATLTTKDIELGTPNVSGKVLPPTGEVGVGQASIEIFDLESWSHVDAWTQTRSNGDFGVELGTGRYYVTVRPPWHNPDGWAQVAFTLDVDTDLNTVVWGGPASNGTVRLNGPTVTGTISAPGVATVADVWIMVERWHDNDTPDTPGDDHWRWHDWTTSRSNGQYGIYIDPDDYGSFRFTAHPPWNGTGGWVRTTKPATVDGTTLVNGQRTLDIELTTGNVKGTVKDPDGATAIQDSWLSVEKQAGDGSWSWYDAWAHSKRDGSFALNLVDDGTYRVTAHPSWYNPNRYVAGTKTVTVSNSGATVVWTGGDTVLLSRGNVSGTVKRLDDQTLVEGAMLDIRYDNDAANPANEPSVDASATTDANGRFSLNLPTDDYLVRALAPVGSGLTHGDFIEVTVDPNDGTLTESWPLKLGS